MNRIDRIFTDLRAVGGKAVMPFVTAGDPSVEATGAILRACAAAGASICEVGVPFSDPIADGPVIQESMNHALLQGTRVSQVFDAVGQLRAAGEQRLGLVAMVSYSVVHRIGSEAFVSRAKSAGFDGFIFPDLPLEESDAVRACVAEADMTLSLLIAPTTPVARAQRIARACSGFVYVMSRAGITGERSELPPDLPQRLAAIREATDLPIAVGFGISTSQQVRQVVSVADAAIVGSALVRRIAANRAASTAQISEHVADFVRELVQGLTPAGG
jgi:tryptophan synthase alpha chain